MDVAELTRKVSRLQKSLQKTKELTDNLATLREETQSLEGKMEDPKERIGKASLGEELRGLKR